jgi:hypothetical protein
VNPIVMLGRLFFAPDRARTGDPAQDDKKMAWIGTLAGMVGLGIQIGWLIPEDVIGFGWTFEPALFINKALGVSIGVLLVVLLFLFERLFFAIFKIEKVAAAVQGSLAVFLLVPFTAIPLHSFYPVGVTASGHVELFLILFGLFITWHICILEALQRGDSGQLDGARLESPRPMWQVLGILLVMEVGLGILALVVLPAAFGQTMAEFFREWI